MLCFFVVEINSIDMYIHYYICCDMYIHYYICCDMYSHYHICCVLFILVPINRSNVYAEIKYVQACDCIM
jgi:amino acid permease